jgi:hypothetical protein
MLKLQRFLAQSLQIVFGVAGCPDPRLFEVTWFKEFEYQEQTTVRLARLGKPGLLSYRVLMLECFGVSLRLQGGL